MEALRGLKLNAMARDFIEAAKVAEKKQLTYEHYLASLLQTELSEKHAAKVKRFIKEAGFPMVKTEADFDFKKRTGITEKQFSRLAQGDFVKTATNIVFFGDFSVGK